MADVLHVTVREKHGTSHSRRLRRAGGVPIVLYGLEKENLSLAAPHEDVDAAIRHGSKLVNLSGAADDSALISDIQWDPLGIKVLHIDLTRVNPDDRVVTEVAVELRGIAPGSKEGGIVDQVVHEVEVDCPVTRIPDKLELNINGLQLGQALHASDLPIESGIKLVTDPETMIVHCVEPAPELDEELEGVAGAAEPELIGRPPEEQEEGD